MLLSRRKDNPQVEGSVLALFQQSDRLVAQNEAAGIAHSDRKSRVAATIAAGVSLNQVAKSFADHRAVDGVSLEIAAGEIICLLGPSGCGKTTLLRLIAGLDRLDSGRIAIGEVEVSSREVFMPPEKRGVGLMFQDFALFPHLRVIDNVAFGLKRLGRDKALAEARAALVRMGLEHYAGHYPHMLSGGQQQRVALARAIVPRPAVLLMDEPFSGLDGRLRHIIREETLAILRAARATAILVTHDAEEAMRWDPPGQHSTFRFATEDIRIGDVVIPAYAQVIVSLAAANRDPARYRDAESFDIHRTDGGHLALGHGVHHCLGAPLARLEARIALAALHTRFPAMQLAVDPAQLRWGHGDGLVLRGLSELPVHLVAG